MYYSLYETKEDALRAAARAVLGTRGDWSLDLRRVETVAPGLLAPRHRRSADESAHWSGVDPAVQHDGVSPLAGVVVESSGDFARNGENRGTAREARGFAWYC